MQWKWIEPAVVLAVHDQQIAEHGGAKGLRDIGLMQSSIDRPRSISSYSAADVFDLAAAYGYGLARNHPFVDGNKRTAYVVTRLFLRLNHHDFSAPPGERVLVFEQLSAGEMSLEAFAAWLRRRGKSR